MRQILLSTTNDEESRLAVIENGRLADYLSVVAGREDRKGSVLCGIISEVEESLDACFVDIGDSKKGFLQFKDIHKDCVPGYNGSGSVGNFLQRGMPVLVQISKDSRDNKGPLLTTEIKLLSHHLSMMARTKNPAPLKVSQKASGDERQKIMQSEHLLGAPSGQTLIVRQNGLDSPVDELVWERNSLLSLWDLIQQVFDKQDSPTLIYEYRGIVNICLTEYLTRDTQEIVCDSTDTETEIRNTLDTIGGEFSTTIRTVAEDESLFSDNVLRQLDALSSRKVKLPSGGEIVIDTTEAMTVIDVNSARSRAKSNIEDTALSTNLEAATEIAIQLKLRNLSGLVVIDFIDMAQPEGRDKIEAHFRKSMRRDRARASTGSISQFGLLEMTRQNIGSPLHVTHSLICDRCEGTGRLPIVRSYAASIIDKIKDLALNRSNVGTIVAELPLEAATYLLNEKREDLQAIKQDLGVETVIVPSPAMTASEQRFSIEKGRGSGNKASYKYKLKDNLSRDSYTSEPKSRRKDMAAAITGVKRTSSRPQGQPAKAAADGPGEPEAKFSFGSFVKSIISATIGGNGEKPSDKEPEQDAAATDQDRQAPQEPRKRKPRSRSRANKPAGQGRSGASKGKGEASGRQNERGAKKPGRRRQRKDAGQQDGPQAKGKDQARDQAHEGKPEGNGKEAASDTTATATANVEAASDKGVSASDVTVKGQADGKRPTSPAPAGDGNNEAKAEVSGKPDAGQPGSQAGPGPTARDGEKAQPPASGPGNNVSEGGNRRDDEPKAPATTASQGPKGKSEVDDAAAQDAVLRRDRGNTVRRNKISQ